MNSIAEIAATELDKLNSKYFSQVINNDLVKATMGEELCLIEPSWFFPILLSKMCEKNREDEPAKMAELAIELVYQGYSIHYLHESRKGSGELRNALITGDFLYAKGLDEIRKIGDPHFVEILAELIECLADIEGQKEENGLIFEIDDLHSSELRSILPWYRMVFEISAKLEGARPEVAFAARKVGFLVGLCTGAKVFKLSALEEDSLEEIDSILSSIKSKKLEGWARVALEMGN